MDVWISKCVVVGILMCRMCVGEKKIKWAMILLPISALSRMFGGKKDQVGNDIAIH